MPRMTAREELQRLHEQHAELTERVNYLGRECDALDRTRRKLGVRFTEVWTRRNWIERRIMLLERKITQCAPAKERAPRKEMDASALIAKLSPAERQALVLILQKGITK
jgi:hypothetical protein